MLMRMKSGRSLGVTFFQVLAAVARDVDQAVVGAGPDGVHVFGRGRDGENGRVDFGAVLILGDGAAGIAQRFRIGAGQIGADHLPGLALIGGLPEMLRRGVENVRIDGIEDDGEGPLPALLERAGRHAGEEQRVHLHVAHVAGVAIVTGEQRALAAGIEECRDLWDRARCSRSRRRRANKRVDRVPTCCPRLRLRVRRARW